MDYLIYFLSSGVSSFLPSAASPVVSLLSFPVESPAFPSLAASDALSDFASSDINVMESHISLFTFISVSLFHSS